MNLTFITSGELPHKDLHKLFDSIRTIKVDPDKRTLHQRVAVIEKDLEEKGIFPFDINEFVICTSDLEDLGEVIARNKLNYALLSKENDNDKIKINNKSVSPEITLGGKNISLLNAFYFPNTHNNRKLRVLLIAPHFEEETALVMSFLHKKAGDEVKILFTVDIPDNPGWKERSYEVYKEIFGLSENEYAFLGIKDKEIVSAKKEFQSLIKEEIEKFKPTTIILTPEGSNFTHKYVLRHSWEVVKDLDVDILLGDVIQNTRFRPTIYSILDWEYVDKFVSAHSDGRFGGRKFGPLIRNLFTKLPEPLSRYVSDLEVNNSEKYHKVGVFGLQPIRVKFGYNVPHATRIFDN